MTRRRIALHLVALALVVLSIAGAYALMHSRYAVPWLIEDLASDDAGTRRRAMAGLARQGADALPAVDALLALARPERKAADRVDAAGALVEISPAAAVNLIPRLGEELRDREAKVRYQAAMTLAALGPLGRPALPALVAAARDPHELVRRWAVNALGRIGAAGPEASAALVAALDDASEAVRHDALLAFSYGFVPRAALAQAEPALRRLTGHRRHAGLAAGVVREIEQPRPVALEVQLLGSALKSRHTGARFALQKLALLGPEAAPALPGIQAALGDASALNRYLAIEALVAIGPAAASALPALRARLDDPDAFVRRSAAAAVASRESGLAKDKP